MDALFIFGAKYLFILAVIIFAAVFFMAARPIKKKFLLLAVIALPLTYILALIAGHIYYDPRPFVVGNFTPLIPHGADNGFPSDHTIFVAAMAMILYAFNKKASLAVWVIAILVGLSRVYVGVHHWVDIAGSLVLALIGGYIANFIVKRFEKKQLPSIGQ